MKKKCNAGTQQNEVCICFLTYHYASFTSSLFCWGWGEKDN